MNEGERDGRIWHVQVFGGADAAGNPTGIVLPENRRDGAALQRAALALGFPDTGFAWAATGT